MQIQPTSPVSFGYRHPLKTLYKKGQFPTVRKDVFGNKLSVKSVTLDHIIPVAEGGKTEINNLMLMDKRANNERGTRPLNEMITVQQLLDYCAQFLKIKLPDFNGKKYVDGILKTLGF